MVLVTGATGLLGRVIVLQLLKKGVQVRATKRASGDLNEVKHSFSFYTENAEELFQKIEWVNIDFEDLDSLKSAVKGVEEIYHCAAKVSMNPKDRKSLYKTNIEGTKNLLYVCENSAVKKFCFISSVSTLDGLNAEGKYDEESHYKAALRHSAYAKSKHFSEIEVWRAAAEGMNVAVVLPAMILASGRWNSSSGVIFRTFEKNKFTFSGGANYVDVRDVAKICIELMERNIFGERFIAVSGNKTYRDFAQKIRNRFGSSSPKVIPDFLLHFARIFNVFGFLIPPLKMVNKVNIDAVTTNHKLSNEKVKKVLNFDFIPVDESIDFHLGNYIKDKNK